MDINYIILAHNSPAQIKRQILALQDQDTFFYLHIDKKVDIEPFEKELTNLPNVYFLQGNERERCIWGDISLVIATLNALKEVVKRSQAGYVTVLSGQDYPIKSPYLIRRFFSEYAGCEFIEMEKLPVRGWSNGGLDRIRLYKTNRSELREDFSLYSSVFDSSFYTWKNIKNITLLLRKFEFSFLKNLVRKKTPPTGLKLYGGSAWWSLTIPTCIKILDFINCRPEVLDFFSTCLLPDELFFQSVIMSAEIDRLCIEPSLTYANWTRPNCPLPVVFREGDFEELKNQHWNLYARKFVSSEDEAILNLLDHYIISEGDS